MRTNGELLDQAKLDLGSNDLYKAYLSDVADELSFLLSSGMKKGDIWEKFIKSNKVSRVFLKSTKRKVEEILRKRRRFYIESLVKCTESSHTLKKISYLKKVTQSEKMIGDIATGFLELFHDLNPFQIRTIFIRKNIPDKVIGDINIRASFMEFLQSSFPDIVSSLDDSKMKNLRKLVAGKILLITNDRIATLIEFISLDIFDGDLSEINSSAFENSDTKSSKQVSDESIKFNNIIDLLIQQRLEGIDLTGADKVDFKLAVKENIIKKIKGNKPNFDFSKNSVAELTVAAE